MRTSAEIVICGAGIAGLSAAYMLNTKHGYKDILLVDEGSPMSLTSDKSTEGYRNWWPGPGDAMVKLMNRSIELLEEIAIESGNVFHLNRRGYLYCITKTENIEALVAFAEEASNLGAGEIRKHRSENNSYLPAEPEGFESSLDGADLFLNQTLIQKYFPYLSNNIIAVLHVRNAGWLSAQQLGAYLLASTKENGLTFMEDRVVSIKEQNGKISSLELASGAVIETEIFINAAGPMIKPVGQMLNIDIPVVNELHLKASINDPEIAVDRLAPMVILAEALRLPWTEEEKSWLAEDEETFFLTESLPSGAHFRPEGGLEATNILMLWDLHNEETDAVFPPEIDPMYAELALRGICTLVPKLQTYLEKMPKPFMDGGYYTKTIENRPLASKTNVNGYYIIGAMAGYGIMAAAGLAEIMAAHIAGADLPEYASAFSLDRYQDLGYQELLENWGDSWQL